ncbi:MULTISPECIES: hypothetical protein [Nitrincola]|nr:MULTISPECIES: hypothetical protein [Nitrincola]
MSALDLFASALGAIILVMIILFPYYLNVSPIDPSDLYDQLQIAEKKNKDLEEQNKELEKQAKATYLLITLSWNSSPDIDLYVRDPNGNLFNYSRHNRVEAGASARPHFPNSAAELSEDATRGPASEIWVTPKAETGKYEVYYHYYTNGSTPVVLQGRIFHSNGIDKLPPVTLRGRANAPGLHAATIHVNDEGDVRVDSHL